MDQEIFKKIEEQNKKLEEIRVSVEKMKKYFFWTLVITIAVLVIPLLGLMFIIPNFISVYSGNLNF